MRARRRRRGDPGSGQVIALFGLFGVDNIGNEASLRAVLEAAARHAPGAEIHCVCRIPSRVESEHGIAAHPLAAPGPLRRLRSRSRPLRALTKLPVEAVRWASVYRFLRRTDLLLVPGTGILDDFGEPPSQLPLDVYRWSVTTRVTGTRLVYLGVGAGPIEHPKSRWLMRRGVAAAADVSFRDDVSRRFMTSIGRDTSRDRIVPDLAFSLPVDERQPARPIDRTVVGLGVMAYYGWTNDRAVGQAIYDAYLRKLVELALALLARGHSIRVLVGEGSDRRMVDDLLAGLAQRSPDLDRERVVAPPIADYAELLAEIGATDIVVATRYHNVVASLMMYRPVISLGYADKNLEVVRPAGLGAYAQHVETFSVDTVMEHVDELLGRRSEVAAELRRLDTTRRSELEVELRTALTGAGITR